MEDKIVFIEKKYQPTQIEEAVFFLELRVRYMQETGGRMGYPSDSLLTHKYGDEVLSFFNQRIRVGIPA